MSTEQNKQVVTALTQAFNNRNFDQLIGTVLSPEATYEHGGQVDGAQRWIQDAVECLVSFPDGHLTIEDQRAEGDEVTTLLRFEGTHTGPLGQMAPTGKSFSIKIETASRVVGGLIVEHKEDVDEMGLMRQLGLGAAEADR